MRSAASTGQRSYGGGEGRDTERAQLLSRTSPAPRYQYEQDGEEKQTYLTYAYLICIRTTALTTSGILICFLLNFSNIACTSHTKEWSDELGYIAQFWAIGCEYMANENRHDQSQDFDVVGESRLATLSYSVNYTNLLGTWFSEKKYYDYDTATCTVYDDEEEEEEERRASGGEVEGEEEDGEGVEKEDEEQDECGRYTQASHAR